MHIANWSYREIETVIDETLTKLGYPAANLEELEAVKEFVKGKDVLSSFLRRMAVESPSATVVCHLCSTICTAVPRRCLLFLS